MYADQIEVSIAAKHGDNLLDASVMAEIVYIDELIRKEFIVEDRGQNYSYESFCGQFCRLNLPAQIFMRVTIIDFLIQLTVTFSSKL